jgi:hypothetical protein
MKKNIIIFCTVLVTLSLSAFGLINWNDSEKDQLETKEIDSDVDSTAQVFEKIEKRIVSDFIYDIGPRFNAVKKSDIDQALTFADFISAELENSIVSYESVEVIIIKDDKESDIREIGFSDVLNSSQIELLRSANYSTNFKIRADYQKKNNETGVLEDSYATPHLTVVPEKQAEYESGKSGLMKYLKEQSKHVVVNVKANELQPAKLLFTVTKEGTIENVRLDRSSRYPSIDNLMIELIIKAPGSWEPARNSEGKKVDQELVVSFGLMGC